MKIKRDLMQCSRAVVVIVCVLVVIFASGVVSLFVSNSTSRSILLLNNQRIERGLKPSIDDRFDNVTIGAMPGAVPKEANGMYVDTPAATYTEDNIRISNAYTQHIVTAKSLTQELYGIVRFPDGTTTIIFQELYDDYVESYFSLKVDPTLLLDSKIIIKNILVPSIADRYLRRQRRNLKTGEDLEEKHEGSSVIITYDQQFSYNFPKDGGMLRLETLVSLPFLTQSGRNEFNLKLKDSDDLILQDVIGVSEVVIPPQSPATQPITSPTRLPTQPVSEDELRPEFSTSQPVTSPTRLPGEPVSEDELRPQFPTSQPVTSPTQLPGEPVSEDGLPPQSFIVQPINSPTQLITRPPAKESTLFPLIQLPSAPPEPTYSDENEPVPIQTKPPVSPPKSPEPPPSKSLTSPPSKPPEPPPSKPPTSPPSKSPEPPPSNPPTVAPKPLKTERPTQIPIKVNPLKKETDSDKEIDSGGISGLIIIGSLMALLFIAFTINMKYCMGEYVD